MRSDSFQAWRRVRAPLVAAAVGLALLLGCKAHPGDACEASQATCEDPATALACQGGIFVEAHCRGPAGCTKSGASLACDDSVAVENEACLEKKAKSDRTEVASRACTPDKRASLVCRAGKWRAGQICVGPLGCASQGNVVTCDARGAKVGDPCPGAGTFSCALDAKSRLSCQAGKFEFDRYCRGQAGCRDSDLSCDQSISALGDPCGIPGMAACSPDGKSAMLCQGGRFVVQRDCAGSGCQVGGGREILCR